MRKKGLGKLLVGGAIGAGLGLLFAPKAGAETRKDLSLKLDELLSKIKAIDPEDIKDMIENKVEDIKKDLKDLDQEKVVKLAKQKSKEISKKADALVKMAKEKGTPAIQKLAKETKEKTAEVLKEIAERLENEETNNKKTK